jgi:membrane protease YdiL (CAAX protease family)
MNTTLTTRLMANPLVRIVLGILLTFVWVPLTMILATQLTDKPHRIVWPQLLAAVLVWFGYRFWVHRVEKRRATELAVPGMARELGLGLLIGAALVLLTFAVLAALGVYRLDGVNPAGAMLPALLIPLAEMLLVGLAEEMIFRGVVFSVTERALGSKAAVAISALVFGLAHLPNESVSAVAIALIAAYGVMQAALFMATRRLWICIGTHVAWNYCVSTVFSSTVSGHAAGKGLLRGTLAGDPVLTGGTFGVEGSVVTLVLIVLTALAAFRLCRRAAPAHAAAPVTAP